MAIFPSSTSWITARSSEAQLNDQNCKIVLPQKIDKIDKVVLNLPHASVRFGIAGMPSASLSQLYLDEQHSKSLVELDVTHYVVEKAEYDTLLRQNANKGISIGPKRLENTWYYEHGNNEILLPNGIMRGNLPISGKPITDYVVTSAIYNVVYNGGKNDGKLYVYYGPNDSNNRILTGQDECRVFPESVTNLIDMQFRIYYTPLGESVKLNVPKTNPQAEQFVIPYSQQQPIVDNISHGRELQSIANRAGCETKEVVRTFLGIKNYRSPHDHWFYREKDATGKFTGNVWRLTSATFSVVGFDEKNNCHVYRSQEVWSKNWNYRSANVPIDREFRSWNIPADVLQRNLLWQDYCLITQKDVDLPDNALISDFAKKQLFFTLIRSLYPSYFSKNEISAAWFYQRYESSDTRQGAVLSCSAFGFGNSLVFSAKTKDNLSAGVQRVKIDSSDSNYQFCKDVYYCNEDGRLEDMCIQIASDISNLDANKYPEYFELKNPIPILNTKYNSMPEENSLFKSDMSFHVDKDPAEQLNFTYQLHLLTDDGSLVIGPAWASKNPLVKSVGDKGMEIRYWYLTSYLPAGAKVMTDAYGVEAPSNKNPIEVNGVSQTIKFRFDPIQSGAKVDGKDVVGLCATDADGNILIAYNSNKDATFKAKFTHDYKAMYKAIKAR